MVEKTVKLNNYGKSVNGELSVPGDKSIAHRALIFGAMASGTTSVSRFPNNEDCLSTMRCLRQLGIEIEHVGEDVAIHGKGWDGFSAPKEILNVGNSGTTIRLMMGLLSGLDLTASFEGDASIAKRPMKRVTGPLSEMGVHVEGRENGNFTPIKITGCNLSPIHYEMPVASAQVKSAIILAALQAEGETVVVEKAPTRDHTELMIRDFGGTIEVEGTKITVRGKQNLIAQDVVVPGDISSAAFWMVAGLIAQNSEVKIVDVGLNKLRTGILEVLQAMGADIKVVQKNDTAEPIGDIIVRTSNLNGTVIEGDLIPKLIDELPIIALLATQASGTTIVRDAEELRVKETDRIGAICSELKQLGANITEMPDGFVIKGGTKLHGGKVKSFGDHRIGMTMTIASLVADGEIEIENSEAVAVSYPSFFEHFHKLSN